MEKEREGGRALRDKGEGGRERGMEGWMEGGREGRIGREVKNLA